MALLGVAGVSVFCSLVFSRLRQHRFLAHSYFGRFNIVEYFGYGTKAFLLSLPVIFLGLSILYLIGWTFANVSPVGKVLMVVVVIAILTSSVCFHPLAAVNRLFPRIQPKLRSGKTYVVFTFDTEEDWDGFAYYNSYKYITSGALHHLIEGFAERGITATFYVTPNLCKDMPEVIRYLEDRNQTVGVHLHPHNVTAVSYPYKSPYLGARRDEIANYSFSEKTKLMNLTKEQIESAIGHKVLLFRSGKHSCDYELEKISKAVGYEAISNHRGNYFIQPAGIWNLDSGIYDITAHKTDKVDDYIEVFAKAKERIITFTGHPMLLYDQKLGRTNEEQLGHIFKFIDYLTGRGDVELIGQYDLLQLVKTKVK